MLFEIEEARNRGASIKVVGVGGAGGNAVNNMISASLHGVEFIVVNTDMQVLETSLAPVRVQIGSAITRGLGAGSNPQIGRESALEDRDAIAELLKGADMVFITAGMGGGTGTGATPIIAGIAKELGALTVAVVTKPFFYEARKRALNAEDGIKELKKEVDTLIVIPNDRIISVVEEKTPLLKSFAVANDVLRQAVQGISDIILTPGLINVDFADVRTITQNTGRAVMGTGVGKGEGRAVEAAKRAISNPILEDSSINGASGVLLNITGGIDLSLSEVQAAASIIYESAHKDANVIFGAVINPDIEDEVRVTVIATGFEEKKEREEQPVRNKTAVKEPVKNPMKEPPVFRGSDRLLAKTLQPSGAAQQSAPDLMPYEDSLDIPTFMRKAPEQLNVPGVL